MPDMLIHHVNSPDFSNPTLCGTFLWDDAVTGWEGVTCPACLALHNVTRKGLLELYDSLHTQNAAALDQFFHSRDQEMERAFGRNGW